MIHFRCPVCKKTSRTIKHLVNHLSSVHGEILTKVPNSIEGRESPENDVFGMKGIPESQYVAWRTSIDPEFKEKTKNINLEGAFMANESTHYAALNHDATSSNIIYNQLNQFQKANIQFNPATGTIITNKGVITTANIQKDSIKVPTNVEASQRKYEAAMRKAEEIIKESMRNVENEKKKQMKLRNKKEVLYFQPVDGLSVFEMRANYLLQKEQLESQHVDAEV